MLKSSKKAAGKKKKALLSVCLAAALLITGAVAFMTATDSADNVFTVGNVKIDLTEPNWDETKAEDIISGQVIAKDPTVTNTGANNAYVYVMVEVPKVYKTDIVSQNAEGKWVTEEKSQYQLFDYAVNDGWTLIDSKVTTEADSNEAYNYYLYAYDTSVAPTGSVTLFDEVKFANVTSNFINAVTGEEIVDLDINVTSYAIQSDFYGNEATDAASAWTLFANQNEWQWPSNGYVDLTTLNFMSEGEVVHTEIDYAGAPVTMFFTPSLARTGYSFDWVDETTNEVGYTGMPMPEEDTNMIATYEEIGNEYKESNKLSYEVYFDENNEPYLSLVSWGGETGNIAVPSSITFTTWDYYIDGDYQLSNDAPLVNCTFTEDLSKATFACDTEYTLPVKKIGYHTKLGDGSGNLGTSFHGTIENIHLPDSIEEISDKALSIDTLKSINLPYNIKKIGTAAFASTNSLEQINLPNTIETIDLLFSNSSIKKVEIPKSVKTISNGAFNNCKNLKSIVIPDNVTSIGEQAFRDCTNLNSITIGSGVNRIEVDTFAGCINLKSISLSNSMTFINTKTFSDCTALTDIYFSGTEDEWNSIEFFGDDENFFAATIHYNS